MSCPAVKERRYRTNTARYGAANLFAVIHELPQFAVASQIMRNSASDRMTDTSRGLGFRNPATLSTANKSFREKHGVSNPMDLKHVREKVIATNIERYGAPCKVATLVQYQRSKIANEWLDSLGVPEEARECWLQVNERRIKVDAYIPVTNTVYEFHGNYWHGNPKLFSSNTINQQAYKTMGELYEATLKREALLSEQGFSLVIMWEDEYRKAN